MTAAGRIGVGVIATLVSAFLGALGFGRYLRNRGQPPFDAAALAADGGRYAATADGRRVEYFVYGSPDVDAAVVVNMHGSGPEARSEMALHAPVCEQLGVRSIAISLPGYGYTDMKPGRRIADWASEDLLVVLEREGVEDFMITGHSQGTPHAMAAAYRHPDRCFGLGLNAPLLPASLCQEEGLEAAAGADSLFSTETLIKPYMAWYFAIYHLSVKTLGPWLPMRGLTAGRPKVKEDTALMNRFRDTLTRALVRGSVGGAWESAGDVCYEWGFDPREIRVPNVVIWHAQDDNWCPPELGRWLAGMFAERQDVRVDFRADNEGFGHLTYCRSEYARPETSMIAALIGGWPAPGSREGTELGERDRPS